MKKSSLQKNYIKGQWSESAKKVLAERYLLKDETGQVLETPEEMCYRVAKALAKVEEKWGVKGRELEKLTQAFCEIMIRQEFLPNSPTLANAGRENKLQLSACYVLPVEDSLIGIFDAIKNAAIIHQSGGGTGFAFSRLRPHASFVASSGGQASGPVGFMRIFDAATQEVKQGGIRRGANMGILRIDHPDVLEFIQCKLGGGITNFNISLGVTDKFMEALEKDTEYELINPHTKKAVNQLKARDVFEKIYQAAWQSGDPGMIWLDRINSGRANPVPELGPIEATNPCVAGKTLVATQNGLVKMEDLVKKKMAIQILTDNRILKEKGVSLRSHSHLFDNGKKDVWRLKTRAGFELLGTTDHKIATPKGWIPLGKLTSKDEVLIQAGAGSWNKDKALTFKPSLETFPKNWSQELGWVLGWLIGDGWLREGDKNCRVGFTFGEGDKKILSLLKPIINTWYGKNINEIKRENSVFHLSYHGGDFVNFFQKLGVKAVKAEEKEAPLNFFTAPKEAVVGFLQGIFTADGTAGFIVGHSAYIRLTAKSKKLLQDVQLLLLNLGVFSKIYDRSRKPAVKFSYRTKKGEDKNYLTDGKLWELEISKDQVLLFLKEVGFLEGKHAEKINKLQTKSYYQTEFVDQVAAVGAAGSEEVYDLTEPVTHSFIANGFVVSNCGEQPLYPNEACNLGSLNVSLFVKDGKIDWKKMKEVIQLSIRLLDNVIEGNPYPLPEIDKACKANRRVGLGLMGWADLLFQLQIPYESNEALELGEKLMKFITEEGHRASQALAKVRGPFPNFPRSIYKNGPVLRNSTVTTIAPTGTISIIANCSSGIEPIFALAFSHIVGKRHLKFVNPYFLEAAKQAKLSEEILAKIEEDGRINGLDVPEKLKKVFKIAHEIEPVWHVKMQAAFQKYTDNAVSKTINLPHDALAEDVRDAYLLAYKLGCLGITVFRDGSKSEQVLHVGKPVQTQEVIKKTRPEIVAGATYRMETPLGTAFITINQNENEPLETFINIGKAGSDVAAEAEALGRLISLLLRIASPLPVRERAQEIVKQLQGIGGARSLGFGEKRVRSLPDAIAKALALHFDLKSKNGHGLNGSVKLISGNMDEAAYPGKIKFDLCPKCGEAAVAYEEGCRKCHSCGYSEC